MYIHAISSFICDPTDDLDGLKADLKNYTDFFFRRVNKFILLSLMGVHRCIHGRNIATSIAVYLATENGNLGDTENVLHQLYKENSFPKPFNFINTMSNTASFYVAQSLKTTGRSITVSSKNVSFERCLELVKADFDLNHITEAVVGGVDEAVISRDSFVKKYDPSYHNVKLVEGSSWLYLTREKTGASGEIAEIKTFYDNHEAIQWVAGQTGAGTVMAFGILMNPQDKDAWRNALPGALEMNYITTYGFYDTAVSFAVGHFIESGMGTTLVHLNRNTQGHYVVLICKKY